MKANQIRDTAPVRRKRAGVREWGALLVFAAGLLAAAPATAQQTPDNLSPATIRMLQHSLMQGGYAVDAADGVWGAKTVAALREFQRVKGLQVTGRADPQTMAALGVSANGVTQPPGMRQAGAADKLPPVRARTPADLDRTTIRAIQQALERQGLKVGAADGVWGERTTSAIGNFQRARGMPASGVPDAHTLAALGLLPGSTDRPAPVRDGQSPRAADLDPAAIRMIQQALTQRGFDNGTPDGIWGDRTVSALRDFQRTRGLEPGGEPDVHTLAALGLLPASQINSRKAVR
jgi:peptidoglycan hydrolase-like protein with peptidoglycan-binding domain